MIYRGTLYCAYTFDLAYKDITNILSVTTYVIPSMCTCGCVVLIFFLHFRYGVDYFNLFYVVMDTEVHN